MNYKLYIVKNENPSLFLAKDSFVAKTRIESTAAMYDPQDLGARHEFKSQALQLGLGEEADEVIRMLDLYHKDVEERAKRCITWGEITYDELATHLKDMDNFLFIQGILCCPYKVQHDPDASNIVLIDNNPNFRPFPFLKRIKTNDGVRYEGWRSFKNTPLKPAEIFKLVRSKDIVHFEPRDDEAAATPCIYIGAYEDIDPNKYTYSFDPYQNSERLNFLSRAEEYGVLEKAQALLESLGLSTEYDDDAEDGYDA